MTESLDTIFHDLLLWDIHLVIDEPEQEPEFKEKVYWIILYSYILSLFFMRHHRHRM
jgi:hypothetical protein